MTKTKTIQTPESDTLSMGKKCVLYLWGIEVVKMGNALLYFGVGHCVRYCTESAPSELRMYAKLKTY